jgi:hypothetical protein
MKTLKSMRAITLWQPWATLIAIGAKRIETRSWSTSYRGPLAIHAAKTIDHLGLLARDPFWRVLINAEYWNPSDFPLGAIVATCNLRQIIKITELNSSRLSEQDRAFGDYSPGRFAWMLDDIVKVVPPIPARGRQGLWHFEFEVTG